MALALCAQLAHLSVLKLSAELHGGGPGRVQPWKSCTLRLYRLEFLLATRQPMKIRDYFPVPPTFDLP